MPAKRRKWPKRLLWCFLAHCLISLVWSWAYYFRAAPRFVGSPPSKYAPRQRNDMDFREHGAWWGKYGKVFRPSGYLDIGPAGLFSPLVHHLSGWDVYSPRICVEGVVAYQPGISDDDGDIGFALVLPPDQERYAWRPGSPMDQSHPRRLVVEIDQPIRRNFPVVYDLAKGDLIRVCGRWVYDRGHDHNEIHPATWIEILRESSEPVRPLR